MNLKSLVALFRLAGAPNPEGWARSQHEEGIEQLARYLFLRQAWRRILDENDNSWIGKMCAAANAAPDAPYAGAGHALKRLLDAGADPNDLTDLVRASQAELLFSFCYLLGDADIREPALKDIQWGLFTVDDDGAPVAPIGGLHESVLETDPTGREMRPRRSGG